MQCLSSSYDNFFLSNTHFQPPSSLGSLACGPTDLNLGIPVGRMINQNLVIGDSVLSVRPCSQSWFHGGTLGTCQDVQSWTSTPAEPVWWGRGGVAVGASEMHPCCPMLLISKKQSVARSSSFPAWQNAHFYVFLPKSFSLFRYTTR